ncbi:hypothetical protein ACRN9X_09460 [Shewanella oncorhynchi]|uniref:hypothetical protein n=1 Tax=Shewanella oncorhynchi TaxID=2726434 RepID=UPI003D7B2F15
MMAEDNSYWYKLVLVICKLMNLSPLFHISSDDRFDSVHNLYGLRFSFISVPCGDRHLYIISYSKQRRFQLFSCLNISDIDKPRTSDKLEEAKLEFSKLKNTHGDSESKLRIEFLKHKQAESQNSINTLNNKVNSYVAIALVYAGFLVYLFKSTLNFSSSPLNILMLSLLALSGVHIVSVFILLRRYLQVKGTFKSKFNSFKESPTWQDLAKCTYIDWLTSNEEKQTSATMVKNIEKHFIRSIVLSTILLGSILLYPYSKNVQIFKKVPLENEFVLLNQEGQFSPRELLKLSESLSPQSTVTFVYSATNVSGKEVTEFIINTLRLSGNNSTVVLSEHLLNGKTLVATIQEKK